MVAGDGHGFQDCVHLIARLEGQLLRGAAG
jgi:hypothetical protein